MATAFLRPYLNFDGNCREAMEFYKECLGGTLTMETFGEAPNTDPKDKDRIMHAQLENDTLTLMAADSMPGMPFVKGTNVSLSISGDDDKRLREIFVKLSRRGQIAVPLEKQFWGDTFGIITDEFGIFWMVNIAAKK